MGEREIAKHYEENAGAYPGFVVFSKVIQNQAKIKNNPIVHSGAKLMPILTLTTNTLPANNDLQSPSPPRGKESTVKRCPFHERAGHNLEEYIVRRPLIRKPSGSRITGSVSGASLETIKLTRAHGKSSVAAGKVVTQTFFTKKDLR